ncbi:hypothetical protein G7085_10025 [Tessaracoccus sp. HDW20]|uniref:hypothetical protein n=1 Tax=Tessaracoccus coleopterorum TaxID=2714950 RepID=UPI0018D4C0F5|nr:hypothetical protein [Tessaracoccus coleopterorum]NHB84818.1 hypothetical protein [Tessaracoccus coleopterorum]
MSDQQPDFRPGEHSGYGQAPYSSRPPIRRGRRATASRRPAVRLPQQGYATPRSSSPTACSSRAT